MVPKAKTKNIEVRSSGASLVVYDEAKNKAICLDHLSAMVWKKCDGRNSPWEIQKSLKADFAIDLEEDDLWHLLTGLNELDLFADDEDDSIERYRAILTDDVPNLELIPIS